MPAMDHSKMTMPGATAPAKEMPGMDHSNMNMSGATSTAKDMAGMDHSAMHAGEMGSMMQLHMKMMSDPVIMKRVMADPAMSRMMTAAMKEMPAEHKAMMQKMMPRRQPAARSTTKSATKSVTKSAIKSAATPVKKVVTKKPAPKKKDPMAGMDHSKMKM